MCAAFLIAILNPKICSLYLRRTAPHYLMEPIFKKMTS